jgi:periplasmic protein TonB
MFEQVLFAETGRTNKGWTVLVSSSMQAGLAAALSIIPLLNTDLLPRTTLQMMLVAPVPPPPPAPPAPAAAKMQPAHPAARRQFDGLHLSDPARIPEKVAMLTSDELPPLADSAGGVPGGVEGGIPGAMSTLVPQLIEAAPVLPPTPKAVEQTAPLRRIAVGGLVQEARIIHKVIPKYPPLARHARISGTVRFTAIIARDGTIQNLTFVSGHPLLVQAAADAVRQWRYRPTLLNGEPVEVISPIDVIFILNQ